MEARAGSTKPPAASHDRPSGNAQIALNCGAIRRVDDRLTQRSGTRIIGIGHGDHHRREEIVGRSGDAGCDGGRHPCSPWGQLAKGGKTRDPRKSSNKRILRRRRSVRYGIQVIKKK